MSLESMPTPEKDGVPFNDWLVPARNNIQRELLRLQKLMGHPTKKGEEIPKVSRRSHTPLFLDLLLGVGFSLWRAVFQAGQSTDWHEKHEKGRIFLDEIIRNNAAAYSTELNSWSFGYYILNAKLRLKEIQACIVQNESTAELHNAMAQLGDSTIAHVWDGPRGWIACFYAMSACIDLIWKQETPLSL